jgi:RNA polymerase sigma factor (sigma-70 family)
MSEIRTTPKKNGAGYIGAFLVGAALSAMPAAADGGEVAVRDISRYCTACWRNARLQPDCWSDCTQEVFSRLLERLNPERWTNVLKLESEERREFLRAIDAVKKRTQRAHRVAPLVEEAADGRQADRDGVEEQRRWVMDEAQRSLTSRQTDILQKSLDGWSVQEIASEMALPPARVSDEKYKAIRKLREVAA